MVVMHLRLNRYMSRRDGGRRGSNACFFGYECAGENRVLHLLSDEYLHVLYRPEGEKRSWLLEVEKVY